MDAYHDEDICYYTNKHFMYKPHKTMCKYSKLIANHRELHGYRGVTPSLFPQLLLLSRFSRLCRFFRLTTGTVTMVAAAFHWPHRWRSGSLVDWWKKAILPTSYLLSPPCSGSQLCAADDRDQKPII